MSGVPIDGHCQPLYRERSFSFDTNCEVSTINNGLDACYDRGIVYFFWRNAFSMTRLHNPKLLSEFFPSFFMILVVYLDIRIFIRQKSRFVSNQLLGGVMAQAPKLRNLRKKMMRLYRSTRRRICGADPIHR